MAYFVEPFSVKVSSNHSLGAIFARSVFGNGVAGGCSGCWLSFSYLMMLILLLVRDVQIFMPTNNNDKHSMIFRISKCQQAS
jgi:hypothetical protein